MTNDSSLDIDIKADRPFHRDPPDGPITVPLTAPPKSSDIDQFFYDPAPPPSAICPRRFPGADPESTDTLIRTLAHNHVSWNIFFNFKGFHNHAAHHLLSIWGMGASDAVIDAAYMTHYVYQRPASESPGHITHDNYSKHLGDQWSRITHSYYSAYLEFFKSELLKKGLAECLEEFLLSSAVNFDKEGEHPAMLSRFITGVIHPFIHVGYGAEFGLLGLSAEGFAMGAVHPSSLGLVDRTWFREIIPGRDQKGCNAIMILSLVACDSRITGVKEIKHGTILDPTLEQYGQIIREYVGMWRFDVTSDAGVASTVEELSWAITILYGVGGHLSSQEFRADFYLMHLMTSSLFLPSLLANISNVSSRRVLLLTYFTTALTFYIARGRPNLDLRGFYNDTEHFLHKVPGTATSPIPGTLPNPSSDLAQAPNAWLPLIQSVLVHPNDHLCKVQRALAHYSSSYGGHRKGWIKALSAPEARGVSPAQLAREEEVEDKVGLKELEGTLFLRVAMLTQNRIGWMREGESPRSWDALGLYASL
ncbi:hypothetical protein V8B97DRAFT_2112267 [Scleroderma yunnanense]